MEWVGRVSGNGCTGEVSVFSDSERGCGRSISRLNPEWLVAAEKVGKPRAAMAEDVGREYRETK